MKALILIGGGGHCISCIDVIENEKCYQVAGIIDRNENCLAVQSGYTYLGSSEHSDEIFNSATNALITLGQIKTPRPRMETFDLMVEFSVNLPTIISSTAYFSRRANAGRGTIVMHGAVVNSEATIGNNCIINSLSLIEHGCHISDHCHISTGARVNGDVKIGKGSFVGSGAIVKQGVTISPYSVIPAGAVVLHNI